MKTFGIEIEVSSKANMITADAAKSYGFDKEFEISIDPDTWDENNLKKSRINQCAEFVSKVFKEKDLKKVTSFLDYLNSKEVTSNKSCATHIHIGYKGYKPYHVQTLIHNAIQWDAVMWTFATEDRRNGFNEVLRIQNAHRILPEYNVGKQTIGGIIAAVQEKREHGINLRSFFKHGTIEFRYFEGSLDSGLILAWIDLCNRFVEVSNYGTIRNQLYGKNVRGMDANHLRQDFLRDLDLNDKSIEMLLNKSHNRKVEFIDPFESI